MTAIFIAGFAILLMYLLFIIIILYYWIKSEEYIKIPGFVPQRFYWIVIPARNEAKNIRKCLTALNQQEFPANHWSAVVVDDDSQDETAAIAASFSQKLIQLKAVDNQSVGKKSALQAGINACPHPNAVIVTLDADTFVNDKWLLSLAAYFESRQLKAATAPIRNYSSGGILAKLQTYDLIATMLLTHLGFQNRRWYLANGANMMFDLQCFQEVNGYHHGGLFASGDDLFLMEQIAKKWPGRVDFIKHKWTVAETYPVEGLKNLIKQRVRWASKVRGLKGANIRYIWLLIFFTLLVPWAFFMLGFFKPVFMVYFLVFWGIKSIADWLFLNGGGEFFEQRITWWNSLLLQPIYSLLILRVAIQSIFTNTYEWKGRNLH